MSAETEKKGPLSWMAKNPVAANILMAFLLIGGILTTLTIRQEVFPAFDIDTVIISVAYPGTSPKEVEEGIILSLEESVRDIEGVKRITSTASEGVGAVTVELVSGTEKSRALADIKNAVDGLRLPEEAERPNVSLITPRMEVISIVIYGDIDEYALLSLAEKARDDLLQKPGITSVEVSGLPSLQISIEIPRDTLRKYNLTLSQVAAKIRASARDISAGGIKAESGEILLRVQERRDKGMELQDIPVVTNPNGGSVRLGEIASITDGFADTDEQARFNGKPAVMVKVSREGDQTPMDVSHASKEYLEEFRSQLPEGVSAETFHDMAEIYEERLDLLMRNAYFGLILVIILLAIFLDIKLAFWVTMGIPISFLGALYFLPLFDVSINMISLFAFIMALGMVVDDAIIVGENIYTLRRKGAGFLEAAVKGTRQVAVPVTFAILTNIVAFMPLLFVEGIMGKIARVIPIVVILAFSISLIEALLILPAHLGHSRKKSDGGIFGAIHRTQDKISSFIEGLIKSVYRPVLELALRNRYFTTAAALALLIIIGAYVASGRIAIEFSPGAESDDVQAVIELPYGSPLEETVRVQDRVVEAAWQTLDELGDRDNCKGIYTRIGSSGGGRGPFGGGVSVSHAANITIYFVSSEEREFETRNFVSLWRKKTGDIPGLEKLTFDVVEHGPPGGSAIHLEMSHSDSDLLELAAGEVAQALTAFPAVKDIDDGMVLGKPQLDFKIKPQASTFGLNPQEIGGQLRSSFYGVEALRLQRGRDEVRAMVRLPESERKRELSIEEFLVRLPGGGEMPVREAASVTRGYAYTTIERVDSRRILNVTADVVPKPEAGRILQEMQTGALSDLKNKYPGLSYSMGGRQQEIGESMTSIYKGFALAMIAIFGMLAVVFRSYIQPVIIMVAIPFGIIGAIIGHIIMGFDLSIMSWMGVVALAGVVVNDSLVLIDFANVRRREGALAFKAVSSAGIQRFRPIILTTLTTFLGLTPMILETSTQARMMVPMAISLGFGILFSTMITLLLVPSLYLIVEDVKRLFRLKALVESKKGEFVLDGEA